MARNGEDEESEVDKALRNFDEGLGKFVERARQNEAYLARHRGSRWRIRLPKKRRRKT